MIGYASITDLLSTICSWYVSESPRTRRLIRQIQTQGLTYVSRRKMRHCTMALDLVRRGNVPGCYIEAGVALGGTAILIAKHKQSGRLLKLYDVFGLIPPPDEQDDSDAHSRYAQIESGFSCGIGGEDYYGYRPDLMQQVIRNLESFNVDMSPDSISLIQGIFEETLTIQEPVAFAHIDCDWHHSVSTCITRIFPNLSLNGIMVFDDYMSYSGCRKAVDSFLQGRSDVHILFSDKSIGIKKILTTASA